MNLKEAFTVLLNTRGALTKIGVDFRRVGNIKARIKEGMYPRPDTMKSYLYQSGWTCAKDSWQRPQ